MIKRLKRKYIILSMVSLLMLLVFMTVGMNIANYFSFIDETDQLLDLLSRVKSTSATPDGSSGFPGGKLPPRLSPEAPYEARYFTVSVDSSGKAVQTDVSKMVTISKETALKYASFVMSGSDLRGFAGQFRYLKVSDTLPDGNGVTRIIFLDCGRKLNALESFALSSATMAAIGYVVISVAVIILSEMIIRPVRESYNKQKQFVTDAGHEIKTPLTVINANADLYEMEYGENEYISEIKAQALRLSELTGSLVSLSRMEEDQASPTMIEFPISDVVSEASASFNALAQVHNKRLALDVEPMLSIKGNEASVRQLVSILLDNAIKYSPEDSDLILSLKKQGRWVCLSVSNKTVTPVDKQSLPHLFDRFYRTDPSRNSQTGGHGIGLSIAKAITDSHGGRIWADSENSSSLTVSVCLPI